ncbi:MAG: pyrroloquinoline-quinone synthase [Candidatus Binatota bacterium]|nr:pyrroloquinoline-quinone synthase [Candidatus Binatota bacterium]
MTSENQQFGDELWGIIGEELAHLQERNRFMRGLFMGELERDRMKLWAKQLFLLTRTGPRFLSAIHSNCEDFEVASWLVQNLYEEYGELAEGRDHPSLCRNFGRALGMSVEELEAGPILKPTRRFVDFCFDVTRNRHYVESLAGIGVALEGVSARGAPMVGAALKQHYGFGDRDVEFFTAHCELDIEHSEKTLSFVVRHASTPELRERVKQTVREMTEQTIEWSVAVGELCLADRGEPARSVA